RTGAFDRARAQLDALEAEVDAIDWDPLRGEWLRASGSVALSASDFARAARDLHEGYVVSRTAGHDSSAARAAMVLAFLAGLQRREMEVARIWLDHVRIDLARGAADPSIAVLVETVEGIMAEHEGRYDDAITHGERAVAIADEQLGEFGQVTARKTL